MQNEPVRILTKDIGETTKLSKTCSKKRLLTKELSGGNTATIVDAVKNNKKRKYTDFKESHMENSQDELHASNGMENFGPQDGTRGRKMRKLNPTSTK